MISRFSSLPDREGTRVDVWKRPRSECDTRGPPRQVCDRGNNSRVGLQRGFIDFIAPLHVGLATLRPGLAPLAARLEATRAGWKACGEVEDAEMEREAAQLMARLDRDVRGSKYTSGA